MHPARCPARLCRVAANAAGAGQQSFRVGGKLLHRNTGHPDVGGSAVAVLAVRGTAHGLVVGGGAVAAGNDHRRTEVIPDALQQLYQRTVHEKRIGAVPAGKFPHPEAAAQQSC